MKKSIILSALVVLVIIACVLFIRDGLTYLITSLMAIAIIGIIHLNRRTVMKITRWAKNNPGKAQVLITVLQVVLLAMGILAGNNLREMGYEFSNATAYIFSTLIIAGFLSIPFLPKRNIIAIPQKVNRHRLAYMSITLSSFIMMALFGNRLGSDHPNSQVTHAVRAIDKAIFADNSAAGVPDDADPDPVYNRNYEQASTHGSSPNSAIFAVYVIHDKEAIAPSTLSKEEIREKLKAEKKAKKFERKKQKLIQLIFKKRPALVVAMGVGAILLIVLLVITTCAGVCLMIGGFAGGGVGYGLLGLVVAAASIFGIVKVSEGNKQKNKPAR